MAADKNEKDPHLVPLLSSFFSMMKDIMKKREVLRFATTLPSIDRMVKMFVPSADRFSNLYRAGYNGDYAI